jgi:hypothetical protein
MNFIKKTVSAKEAIEELAYCECILSCQIDGCLNLLEEGLDERATDPVEVWATKMANVALGVGWSVGTSGKVLCPIHAADQDQVRQSNSEELS